MSDTHRKHLSPSQRAKLGAQPKVRSTFAVDMLLRSGAGAHGKTHKQQRANERTNLRKEYL